MEAQMLLRESSIYPSNEVIKEALGDKIYEVLESFIKTITDKEYDLTPEWRYYNDGKAWLCKIAYKKKTILWLSVWGSFFKTGFYFTEKHLEAIFALDISKGIKEEFELSKPIGRLIPMIIDVREQEQLEDLLTIIHFKKSLK